MENEKNLNQPEDQNLWDRVADLLPTRECFTFRDSEMVTRLMEAGVIHEEATRLVPQLHLGGKVYFIGRGPTVDISICLKPNLKAGESGFNLKSLLA